MKRTSYGERDYAFGQRMLRLRTSIGLTQAGLAQRLRISRQALGEWESGSSYPKAEHLKYVIALGVQQQAFAAGREEEEIRLKIVARTIVELFRGEIAPFLAQGEVVFGGVRELLDEQFDRLSALEQMVFCWLAILREPVSLEELLAVLCTPRTAL